ncbi:Bidirectional sugar transporter SWEET17, partial [Glycine soja]
RSSLRHGFREDFSSLLYICTLLNCFLWTYYGIIKAGKYLVATVNGFVIVVETIYIILLLIYATKGIRGRTTIFDLILDVVILTATVVTTQLALQGETRNGDVGVMGASLNIVRYSSLLSVMKIVVTT